MGGGQKKIRRALLENACKTFFLANFFPLRVLKMKPISLGEISKLIDGLDDLYEGVWNVSFTS